MLGRDIQVDTAGKCDFHRAFAAVAVRIGAPSARGGGSAPVAYGNFALLQIVDTERVAEGAGELFELEDFASVGFFVDAVKGVDAALQQITIDGAVGGE